MHPSLGIFALLSASCGLAVAAAALPPAPTESRAASPRNWAFQPLTHPHLPGAKRVGWTRTPVDAFVLAALEKNRLTPAAATDRRTLIRRVSFDLIGLPPTPEEIEQFVRDPDPAAYEKVVDRLLA